MARCCIPPCRSRRTARSRARIRTRSLRTSARSSRSISRIARMNCDSPTTIAAFSSVGEPFTFTKASFVPIRKRSAEWNRGAYLVEGLGHCGTCHTAINALGGSSDEKAFAGGLIPMQNWYAPSLTNNKEAGLGDWPLDDIIALLKTGQSKRGVVYGPMAEVVHNSLQYLTDADVHAMAVYLKTLPEHTTSASSDSRGGATRVSASTLARGHAIYVAQCASCHLDSGLGQ